MTHFQDLSGATIRHIGWLEAGHAHARGAVSASDLALLERRVDPRSAEYLAACSAVARRAGIG